MSTNNQEQNQPTSIALLLHPEVRIHILYKYGSRRHEEKKCGGSGSLAQNEGGSQTLAKPHLLKFCPKLHPAFIQAANNVIFHEKKTIRHFFNRRRGVIWIFTSDQRFIESFCLPRINNVFQRMEQGFFLAFLASFLSRLFLLARPSTMALSKTSFRFFWVRELHSTYSSHPRPDNTVFVNFIKLGN